MCCDGMGKEGGQQLLFSRETKGEHEITLHDSRGALEALSLDGKEVGPYL